VNEPPLIPLILPVVLIAALAGAVGGFLLASWLLTSRLT
jgi:hypothetical protein